jgi:hypothetical protein
MSAKYPLPDDDLTPRERAILFENCVGNCPRCAAERGYAVPDWCDEPSCPEPWDVEMLTLPPETLQ